MLLLLLLPSARARQVPGLARPLELPPCLSAVSVEGVKSLVDGSNYPYVASVGAPASACAEAIQY